MRLSIMALVLAFAAQAVALDITTCGTTVPSNDEGVLQVDLDCDALLPFGVSLGRGARLHLNGHVLRGASRGVSLDFPSGRAFIEGPGEVAGADTCIAKSSGDLDSRVKIVISNVDIHDCVQGVFADHAVLDDVRLTNNRHGLNINYRIRGSDVVASDNTGFGVWSEAGTVRLRRLTALDNGWFGVIAAQGGRVTLRDSTVTGNAAAYGGIDVASSRRPALVNTVCGHSSDAFSVFDPSPTTWGLCAND